MMKKNKKSPFGDFLLFANMAFICNNLMYGQI